MVAEAISDKTAKETKTAIVQFSADLDDTGTLFDATATIELVAAIPGKKIVVTNLNHWHITFAGTTDGVAVEFKSGSTALTGKILFSNFGAKNTTSTSYMPDGHFWTSKGEALNMTVTDTTAGGAQTIWVYGYINYYEE